MDGIAKKQSGQSVIEDYRQANKEMHNWFDTLIKGMDILDKGSGLSCAQKLTAINELKSEFEKNGPLKMADLKEKASAVTDVISNLDAQQVEEQLKSIERRYNDVSKRIDRKAQIVELTNKGFDGAKNEIDQVHDWVKEKITDLQKPEPLGFESKSIEGRQQKLKGLIKEAESKQVLADTLEKRVANMQSELEPVEQTQLESSLRNLSADQKKLNGMLKTELERQSQAAQARKSMENDLEKAKSWIKAKLLEVRRVSGYLPLHSSDVEREIQLNKKYDSDIKDFNDNTLNDVIKQSNSILKDCSEEDRDHLKKLIDEVVRDYDTLKDECSGKIKSLADLLQGRKLLEEDFNKFNNWCNEADVATSSELRTTSLPILEEQLVKYDKLNKDSNAMSELLTNIYNQGQAVLPTLSNTDKLKLNEQIRNLRERHGKLANLILDRRNMLEDQIKKYKEAKTKMNECVKFMNAIQQEIKELNKPVGSKIEDVQGLLSAYEKILNDLKDNKSKLGEIQVDNLPELATIMAQQDDMIKTIEDQLARLRQLLMLREQFIALINEIITFIMKYTAVITDIEKSGGTIEDKIKCYDDVIVKIQECEAVLASASDKGQQIASEGSAADRNSITEQLQSLKQQLQNLRKSVEAQRQKHEITLAEHKKMAAELNEILDWLHDKESIVKSRPLLDRDPDSVEREIQKQKALTDEINKYLNRIKKINDQSQSEVGMPGSLLELLSEARSLLTSLPNELNEREKYLNSSKQYRLEYMELLSRFNAWVHEAEIRLQSGKHGVDYENIQTDLEEHKIFFSTENSIKDLVSRQIQEAADKIWPSLSTMEQEELSRELQHHSQVLKNTLNSAKSQQTQLEQDVEIWKEYCQNFEKIQNNLLRVQFVDEPVSNLAGVHFNIQKLTHAYNTVQVRIFNIFIVEINVPIV